MPIKIPHIKGLPITKNEEGKYEYPNAVEFIKLSETEQEKLYIQVNKDLQRVKGFVAGIPAEKTFVTTAKNAARKEPYLTAFQARGVLDSLLEVYAQALGTDEERAKLSEKKGVKASGPPSKWATLAHYGQMGLDKAAAGAAQVADVTGQVGGYAAQAGAAYDFAADQYNNYVDYKIDQLARQGDPKCIFDLAGTGSIGTGGEKAVKCVTFEDGTDTCPPGQTCLEGLKILEEFGKSLTGKDLIPGDQSQGYCIPACKVPEIYDFLRQLDDPEEDVDFGEVVSFIDALGKPPPPLSSCVVPHVDKFFNVIPWQYFIMKALMAMVDDLLSQLDLQGFNDLDELIKEKTKCGADGLDLDSIKAGAHLPSAADLVPWPDFLPFPPLPYIPWPPPGLGSLIRIYMKPMDVVRVIIIDSMCWAICKVLNPIIYAILGIMLGLEEDYLENHDEETGASLTSLPAASEFTMKKNDVNSFVTDDILEDANSRGYVVLKNVGGKAQGTTSIDADHQHIFEIDKDGNGTAKEVCHPMSNNICHTHEIVNGMVRTEQSECYPNCKQRYGVCGVPPHIHEIPDDAFYATVRKYIKEVNYEKRMTVKDLITLLAGSANCPVKGVLLEVGKREEYQNLELTDTRKILQFWQYLGNNINMFEFIEQSKIDCSPQVCPKPIEEQMLMNLMEEMNKACALMKEPELLLPFGQDELKALAIDVGNQMLANSGFGGQLSESEPGNIIPEEEYKMMVLSDKCKATAKSYADDCLVGKTAKLKKDAPSKCKHGILGQGDMPDPKDIADGGWKKFRFDGDTDDYELKPNADKKTRYLINDGPVVGPCTDDDDCGTHNNAKCEAGQCQPKKWSGQVDEDPWGVTKVVIIPPTPVTDEYAIYFYTGDCDN